MTRTIQLRHLERASVLHKMRPDAKTVAMLTITTAIAFNPGWPALGVGWVLAIVLFVASRLPRLILAPPPRVLLVVLSFSLMFSLLSGGDPSVGGIQVGGLIELAQFLALGFLLVALAALLVWTTSLTDIGLGLTRLLAPLRILRFPVDDLGTTIVLAIRSLPAVRSELTVTMDARRTRPQLPTKRRGFRAATADAVDIGATVVVGAHRRATEMARSMVARNSTTAPAAKAEPLALRDVVGVIAAAGWATAVFIWL
jgi:energy-coupling factor transport system permease protein